jgi:hypothetical protein
MIISTSTKRVARSIKAEFPDNTYLVAEETAHDGTGVILAISRGGTSVYVRLYTEELEKIGQELAHFAHGLNEEQCA